MSDKQIADARASRGGFRPCSGGHLFRAAHPQVHKELYNTPKPCWVGLAGEDQEALAASEKDGKGGEGRINVGLIDACLIEPY